MRQNFNARIYKWLVYFLILAPNIFVAVVGVESFPLTSAPMFGHYVGADTALYILKFETISGAERINLEPYYDRPEAYFIRHFFSKVYGSPGNISAFNGRLSESPAEFQMRMNAFFNAFTTYAFEYHDLELKQVYLSAIRVDKDRNPLAEAVLLGYYDTATNQYNSLHGTAE